MTMKYYLIDVTNVILKKLQTEFIYEIKISHLTFPTCHSNIGATLT